jgi:hypothetical protein
VFRLGDQQPQITDEIPAFQRISDLRNRIQLIVYYYECRLLSTTWSAVEVGIFLVRKQVTRHKRYLVIIGCSYARELSRLPDNQGAWAFQHPFGSVCTAFNAVE